MIIINDAQWEKLQEGWWVKIASADYIKNVCQGENYKDVQYINYNKEKTAMFGQWVKVRRIDRMEHWIKTEKGYYDFHRDLISDISQTEPITGDAWVVGETEAYENIPCSQAQVGDEIFVRETWKVIQEIAVLPESHYRARGEGRVYAKIDNGNISYNLDRSDYKARRKITSNTKSENKQEKIMLNTVQEIKDPQLDEGNVKAGAKAAKEAIDKAQAEEVRSKLIDLNHQKTSLLRDKAAIEKKIAGIDEMMGLLGFPPAE